MHPHQVPIVQQSWQQLAGIKPQVGVIFYENLFRRDPALRPMFRGDIALQGTRLMAMIDAAVDGLDQPETLTATLVQLGLRHRGYGVRDSDYDTVAAALLETLAAGLGDSFTPAVRQAWSDVYGLLSSAMKLAA